MTFSKGPLLVKEIDLINIPKEALELGQVLFDHQCWVIGKDIKHESGNALERLGFKRIPSPNVSGMTQYDLKNGLKPGWDVQLWGFGAFFGNVEEGLFITRSYFQPFKTTFYNRIDSKEDLPHEPTDPYSERLDLLLAGLRWFSSYESFIDRSTYYDYRIQSLIDFPRFSETTLELLKEHTNGQSFSEAWTKLADLIEEANRVG